MAAKCHDFYSEIDEILICTICLDRYHQPKSLPCLHTYCRSCLQQLIEKARGAKNINCPSCRTTVPIPPGGTESFPDAFLLKTISETIDRFKDDKPKCSTCLTGKQTNATTLCVDHNLKDCRNLRPVLEHTQHKKKSLESVVQGHKDDLQSFLDQLLKRDKHYDKCLLKADKAEEDCQINVCNRMKAINQHEAELYIAVQTVSRQMMTEIEIEGSLILTEIRSVRQIMTQEQAIISNTIRHVRAAMIYANSPSIINSDTDKDKQIYQAILQKLLPQHSLPKMNFDLKFSDVQQMTGKNLIGSLTCTKNSEPLAETVTVPRGSPASKPATLVARKFTVPYQPRGVSCTPQGNIVVCGDGTCNASMYQPDGREVFKLKLPQNARATDVACAADRILVADANTGSILEFKSGGSYVRSVKVGLGDDMGICVLDNKVYVTAPWEKKVYTVDWPGGNKQVFLQDTDNAGIKYPTFVAANRSSVAVSCSLKDTLHVFKKSGCLKFTYTGTTAEAFFWPRGVVIDADGTVLISSCHNNMIHIVSSEGQFLGQIDLKQDGLKWPSGLALNPQGQLVVAAWDTIATYDYKFLAK